MTRTIMVMGGGLAGLTAAKEAATAGYDVILVEKEAELGGKAKGWRKSFPTKAPWTDLEDNPIDALIAEVSGN
ncbi:MAG: FAD-binding protein, partial [Deltaproteobacteria bacterium]|nr:FAD-binding protein [Deltaproteobacteria bacterium]